MRVSARGIHHKRAPETYAADVARPKVYEEERIATAVRLPRSLHEQLHQAADEREVAANLLIVKALEAFLAQLTPVDELVHDPEPVSQAPGRFTR